MGGLLSVTFTNIYLIKLEKDQIKPLKANFCCRFVDDVIGRRLKNTHDSLFENLSNHLEKIKFTIETNQQKFLNTRILSENDIITTAVCRKVNKFSLQWKSQIPKQVQKKCNKWRSISFMENQLKFSS